MKEQVQPLCDIFENFEHSYNSLDNTSSLPLLQDISTRALEVDTRVLESLLKLAHTIDPSLRDFLPSAVDKLARYHQIAIDLVNAARLSTYTLFRRISIAPLSQLAKKKSYPRRNADFTKAIQRITGLKDDSYRWRFPLTALPTLENDFKNRINNPNVERKIHAEIQLVMFYEQHPNLPRPRVICSSKAACFLCNLFIQSYGTFHVPSTHGRIYDGWFPPQSHTLPVATRPKILRTMNKLNQLLENEIMQTLRRKIKAHPEPAESVLYIREPWASTTTIRATVSSTPGMTASSSSTIQGPEIRAGERSLASSSSASAEKDSRSTAQPEEAATERSGSDISFIHANALLEPHSIEHVCMTDAPSKSSSPHSGFTRCDSLLTGIDNSPEIKWFHLAENTSLTQDFANPQSVIAFSANGSIVYASHEHLDESVDKGTLCCVKATIREVDLATNVADEQAQYIDIKRLEPGKDITLESGALLSQKKVALRKGSSVLYLKFSN